MYTYQGDNIYRQKTSREKRKQSLMESMAVFQDSDVTDSRKSRESL